MNNPTPRTVIVNRSFAPPAPGPARIRRVLHTGDEGTGIYVEFDRIVLTRQKPFDIPELLVDDDDSGVCNDQPDTETLDCTYDNNTASKPWSINTQPAGILTPIVLPASGFVQSGP